MQQNFAIQLEKENGQAYEQVMEENRLDMAFEGYSYEFLFIPNSVLLI